jgi:serine/threonine protein kinase
VAISSSISHPHLVQTYTYKVKAIDEEGLLPMVVVKGAGSHSHSKSDRVASSLLAASASSTPICTAYHIQMVLEYCDGGSLRTLLNGTHQSGARLSLSIVLDFSSDVARGKAIDSCIIFNVDGLTIKLLCFQGCFTSITITFFIWTSRRPM